MNLDHAKKLLLNIKENPYPHDGHLFTAMIIPDIIDDRIKFLSDLKDGKATIHDGEKYSSNEEYTIQGFMNIAFNI